MVTAGVLDAWLQYTGEPDRQSLSDRVLLRTDSAAERKELVRRGIILVSDLDDRIDQEFPQVIVELRGCFVEYKVRGNPDRRRKFPIPAIDAIEPDPTVLRFGDLNDQVQAIERCHRKEF